MASRKPLGATPRAPTLRLNNDDQPSQQPSSAGRARRTTATRTAARASPYARTPTKQPARSSLLATPTPATSPGMLTGFISMISPFRALTRARQSAAFGAADEDQDQQDGEQPQQQPAIVEADMQEGGDRPAQGDAGQALSAPSRREAIEPVLDDDDDDEKEVTARRSSARLAVPASAPFVASPSRARSSKLVLDPVSPSLGPNRTPRASVPLPQRDAPRSPLAEGASILPFTPHESTRQRATRYSSHADLTVSSSTMAQSRASIDASPVSRNFDLLARFFAEKQREDGLRGGSSGLTEVEVEGCLKLIEESMATGRDLAHEFGYKPQNKTAHAVDVNSFSLQRGDVASVSSSRATSLAPGPSAFPASQTFGSLFHPGASTKPSGAFSFLAPRSSSAASLAISSAARRHRPLYLGPGMGSQFARRRTVAPASRSLGDSLASSRRGWLPKSTSDTSVTDAARERQQQQEPDVAPEEAKRRRTGHTAQGLGSSSASHQEAGFEKAFESHRSESSELAKKTASAVEAVAAATSGTASGLKRGAPSSAPSGSDVIAPKPEDAYVNGVRPAQNSTPAKAATRTATAMLDILKDSPPVRAPVQPELVNPYQTSSTLSKLPKKPKTQTASRSARASITTRAKLRESAASGAKQDEPPKRESILDVIERTAPKEKSKPGRASITPGAAMNEDEASNADVSTDRDIEAAEAAEARKAEKTEEAKRRLAALSKSREAGKKTEQPTSSSAAPATSTPSFSFQFNGTGGSPQQPQPQSQNAGTGTSTAPATSFSFSASKPAASLAPQLPPQYTASKPKKPSPLSATFQAPDSPSSASEKSQADSPLPASKAPSKLSQPTFSFGSPSTTSAADPKPTFNPAPLSFSFDAVLANETNASTSAAPLSTSTSKDSAKPAFSFSPIALKPAAAPAVEEAPKKLVPPAVVSEQGGPSKSPRDEALAAPVSSLPVFSFDFTSSDKANKVALSDKDAVAVRKEVASLAEATLPKFRFVFGATAISAPGTEEQPAAKQPPATSVQSFSFGSAAAPASTAAPVNSAPSFSFSKLATAAAPAASTPAFSFSKPVASAPASGFSFTALGGSSGLMTPTSGVSGASSPAASDAAPAAEAESDAATGGEGSNGLVGEGEGEEDETSTHEVRAKFWRFDSEGKAWKDMGIGIAKLKKHKENGKCRMLVRNEANGKVVVNFNIYASIKPKQEKNVLSFLGFDGSTPTQYRCKIKTDQGAQEFKEAVEKEATQL
ncbi:hypothetical protein ACQY0O_005763 [Thecaphora frezii]